MKYLRVFLLSIIILPFISFAQKDELLIGLSVGVNNPIGDFASNEWSINEDNTLETQGEFAKLGTAFDLSANYRIGYYFGFSARILGGTNKIDTKEYSNALNTVIADYDYQLTIASKGWGNMGILAGAYVVIPINDLYIDWRFMAGYANLFSPSMRYYVNDLEGNPAYADPFVTEKYNAGGFAYDLGMGLKYKFASNKFLLVNGDYIGSSVQKNNISTLSPKIQNDGSIIMEEDIVDLNVDYKSLTFTIGLGYIF